MKRQRGEDSCIDNCNQEHREARTVAQHLSRWLNTQAELLNDFTLADLVFRGIQTLDLWTKVQIKTTRSHVIGKPNCWQFDHVKGYSSMLVLCLTCDDENRCWLYDGAYLDQIRPENVVVVPGGKHEVAALAYGSRDGVLRELSACYWRAIGRQLQRPVSPSLTMGRISPFHELCTAEQCCTEFLSSSHQKEQLLVSKWCALVCQPRGWITKQPDGASLAHDQLLSEDGGCTWKRIQLKSVSPRGATSGFRGKLTKSAGAFAGTKKQRPYEVGDADEYVFLYLDDVAKTLDVWTLSEAELDGSRHSTQHISTKERRGTGYITLHLPIEHLNPTKHCIPGSKARPGSSFASKSRWTAGAHVQCKWG